MVRLNAALRAEQAGIPTSAILWPAEPATGCWLWLGETNNGGPVYRSGQARRSVRRLVYEIARGEPLRRSDRLTARCDDPRCIRPSHLARLGADR